MSLDVDRLCRTLVREAADAVIYADTEGLIGFWNKGAERIFGFSESEALEKPLDIIIPENLRNRHWDGYGETVRTGKTRYGAGDSLAVPALRKDGSHLGRVHNPAVSRRPAVRSALRRSCEMSRSASKR